jgi:hypothetical protein
LCSFFLSGHASNYAEEEFERAWNNPQYTQAKLEDLNINDILDTHYDLEAPISFNRDMLWDVETKKAWDPKAYIPYVVREGKSWGRQTLENGDEILVRSSEQRQWLNKDVFEEVFEKVYLNHRDQIATFIGSQSLVDSDGVTIYVDNEQPLFHVQHSVGGEENSPVNVWRIVFLTSEYDSKFVEELTKHNNPTRVPGFVEIYIKKDLNTPFTHK